MKLYLIRGPSGSGKSTIGAHLSGHSKFSSAPAPLFETDQFFTHNGVYKFDVGKLKVAHQLNQLRVEREMFHGVNVVCTNTFIAHWEMERYLELAEEYDYAVEIIKTPGPWDINALFRRNKHNVPLDVIKRHVNGYQPHEKEVEWTDLSIFYEMPF